MANANVGPTPKKRSVASICREAYAFSVSPTLAKDLQRSVRQKNENGREIDTLRRTQKQQLRMVENLDKEAHEAQNRARHERDFYDGLHTQMQHLLLVQCERLTDVEEKKKAVEKAITDRAALPEKIRVENAAAAKALASQLG